jgi:hypothetical protein
VILTTILSITLAILVLVVVVAPGWWAAGRLLDSDSRPIFRLLLGAAIGIVGYLTVVNLVGRQVGNSTVVASAYVVLSLVAVIRLRRRWPSEMSVMPLVITWREWTPVLLVGLVLGMPQLLLAVGTPFWDEVAASAIHLTAANQFAEGMFPPRHNALPDVVIKYHYGFTILSGSVKWLTGLSANNSVDAVSTGLWLFSFLFVVYWLRELKLERAPAMFGGVAALLGGGLGWLYLRSMEAFTGFAIAPDASARVHSFNRDSSLVSNLLGVSRVPSAHLRNGDGTLSNLPWDIAAQFQQHAVAIGIALTLPALFLFVRWQTRSALKWQTFALTIATFAVLFLAHGVFGGVAAVSAGLVLLGVWLRSPTRERFANGVAFGVALAVVALAHGGFLARGAEYGSSSDVFTWRNRLGYSVGGIAGFLNWNLAGFGLPLLLALGAWVVAGLRLRAGRLPRGPADISPAGFAFVLLTVFTAFSYMLPQLAYYTSETNGLEQLTEISKFFFAARLGLALVAAFGVAWLVRRVHWATLVPIGAAMAVMPVAFSYTHFTRATDSGRRWVGLYRAPYYRGSVEQQIATVFREQKRGPREVYFDAAADERRNGYLNELLLFGGSAFTLTPSAYERTGVGYRLATSIVSDRFVLNSKMARLLPGAAETCGCRWFYSRPERDFAFAPMIVRARFSKLVAESAFVQRAAGARRVLYSIDKPTTDVDRDIERYWRPRVVSQAHSDWDGDGRDDLIFYDYVKHKVIAGRTVVDVPAAVASEFTQLYVGRFQGDRKADLHFGRTGNTDFRLGRTVMDINETNDWRWTFRASHTGTWDPEYARFFWNLDIPIIADLDGDGFDSHVVYRPGVREWFAAPNIRVEGPVADEAALPLPFAGRFSRSSKGDLGLWSTARSTFTIRRVGTPLLMELRWGGSPRDVLVPGDYAGLGFDQLAIWNPDNQFWYWRTVPDGAITQFRFGTPTAVPVPADYNHDGVVDPAYWEPRENKIYVTFSRGRRVDLEVTVPPNSIPAFVNWL